MVVFESKFGLRDKVWIDGEDSIVGLVTAISFSTTNPSIEVSWFHNGEAKAAWFQEWRLTKHD